MIQNIFFKILILFIFSTTNVIAQQKSVDLRAVWENEKNSDSVRFNAINKFYIENTTSQPAVVIQVTDFHLELAVIKKNKLEMIKALSEKSYAYFVKDNIKKSEEFTIEAIKIQTTLNDKVGLARLYANLASIYRVQSKFVETIKYYNYALKIFRDIKEEKTEAVILGNLGLVYFDLKNNEIALDYFEKSLKIYTKLKLQDKIGYIDLYIGVANFETGNYEKSIENIKKSLKIFNESNNTIASADSHNLLAKSYQKTNDREQSFIHINESLKLNQKLENTSRIIENKVFLAELYLDSDVKIATLLGEEALAMLDANSNKKLNASVYNVLYQCYKRANKIELSYKMYDNYIVYNDSIVKEQSNLELIKDAVNQEFKIKLLKTKQSFEQSEKDLKRNQLIKVTIIALVFLLLVFSMVFYFRKKNISSREKTDELLEEIEKLKKNGKPITPHNAEVFQLNRKNIETFINRKLNETDWAVLNVLIENPVISNKEIANQVFLSVDGIGSSLRRMYEFFQIGESKYKKTDLIRKAIQISSYS